MNASNEMRSLRIGSLRDFYAMLFRQGRKMALATLGLGALLAVALWVMQDQYRSEARLLVKVGRESVTLDPTASTGPTMHVSQSRESEINSELEILRSLELLNSLVDSVGVGPILGAELTAAEAAQLRSEALRELQANLMVSATEDSNVLSVAYRHPDATTARDILERLLSHYQTKHAAVHQTEGAYEFFADQTEELKKRLDAAESDLSDARRRTGLASLDLQRGKLLDRLNAQQSETESNQAAIAASAARIASLQQILNDVPANTVLQQSTEPNAALVAVRTRLYELRLQELELLKNYTDESRPVADLRRQISEAEALLAEESAKQDQVVSGVNETHQSLELALHQERARHASLEATAASLATQVESTRQELTVLQDNETEIARLERLVQIEEQNYLRYTENLEQARIDHALDQQEISNISVIQSASLPLQPDGPSRASLGAFGILLIVFLVLGLAVCAEFLDDTLRTPETVQSRLGLATLASLPARDANPRTSFEDAAFRKLRDHLKFEKEGPGRARVIGVTGDHDGAGVSTVATDLARRLADQSIGPVLLVDANAAQPSVSRAHHADTTPGLTDLLADRPLRESALKELDTPNLYLLGIGQMRDDFSELFDPAEVREHIGDWSSKCDYIVIDLPPVRSASASTGLARLCDGIVLVLDATRSRWQVVQRVRDLLSGVRARLLGVVLNRREYPIPEWLYQTL